MGKIQRAADRFCVDGRGHQDEFQVRTQHLAGLAREGQCHVGGQAPLVEFIENHHGDALQARIVHETPYEDALRDDLDSRSGRYALLKAHPVTDRAAHRLAEHPGHPLGNLPGGYPPGLEHHDLAFRQRVENGKGQ